MADNNHPFANGNPIMQFFTYAHLSPELQAISKPLAELAELMNSTLENGPEKSTGLRKLLEAKDCLVRQRLIDLKKG
jgi:hypothetical protein